MAELYPVLVQSTAICVDILNSLIYGISFYIYPYCPSLVGDILFQRDTKAQFLDVILQCYVKLMILYGFLRMSCK